MPYKKSDISSMETSHDDDVTQAGRSQSKTFYRRKLPPYLKSFTSREGKRLFIESLHNGHAENYFQLVGNFTTQSEPAFCGYGSLAMVLNALEVDPGRQWKGVWRWYSDDNLECSASNSDLIKQKGITFGEFACLAKCNGLNVISKRADTVERDEFIEDLKKVCSSSDSHMVVSFSRETLGQTGDGHFSPIGSYNEKQNMALILDTARFKYPSYYVPVELLFDSMFPADRETGMPRGYFILSRDDRLSQLYKRRSLCKLNQTIGASNHQLSSLFYKEIPHLIQRETPNTLFDALNIVFRSIPAEYSMILTMNESTSAIDLAAPDSVLTLTDEHDQSLLAVFKEVGSSPLFSIVRDVTSSTAFARKSNQLTIINNILATIFIMSVPREMFKTLPMEICAELDTLRDRKLMSTLLRLEVDKIEDQLSSLMNKNCNCFQRQSIA